MGLRFTPYTLPLLASVILLVVVAATIAWRRPARHWLAHVLLLLGAAEWCLTYALEISSATLEKALFWARAEYIGIGLVALCLPLSALVYSSRERHITRRNVLLLCIMPAISIVAVYTNDLHMLFWTSYGYTDSGRVFQLLLGHGVLFWLNIAFTYASALFVAGTLAFMLHQARGLLRLHLGLILVAAIVPVGAHLLHLLQLSPLPNVELAPLSFSFSGLTLAWGVFRVRLFDVIPIARHAVIENMADGMLVLDMQNRIVDINASAERLLAISRGEVIGEPVGRVPQLGTLRAGWTDPAVAQPMLLSGEDRVRECELHVSSLYSSDKILTGHLLILRDVTVQRRLEHQLRQARKMEAIGQLAGGIAHEFNNQLQIINGYAEFVLEQLEASSPLRSDLEVIQRAGLHSAALTQQLVAFSRQQPVQVVQLDLNDLVTGLRKTLRPIIGEHATLDLRLSPDLSPVRADAGQIPQALINLVANARDAIEEAHALSAQVESGRIVIETANVLLDEAFALAHAGMLPGLYVMLSVSDNGIGLSDEVLQHLFEPFFTTKEVGRGAGLGLATVYGVVKQSNGFIFADRLATGGTAMRIYLPPSPSDGTVPGITVPSLAEAAGGSEQVLVLDDRGSVGAVTAQMLTHLGYSVARATNGKSALTLLDASPSPFELLLTDVSMGHDGAHAVVRRLRNAHAARWPGRPLRVLYMSGYASDALMQRGALASTDTFLPKPFTAEQLAAAVRQALTPGSVI